MDLRPLLCGKALPFAPIATLFPCSAPPHVFWWLGRPSEGERKFRHHRTPYLGSLNDCWWYGGFTGTIRRRWPEGLFYLILIAPERDWNEAHLTFEHMVQSIHFVQ